MNRKIGLYLLVAIIIFINAVPVLAESEYSLTLNLNKTRVELDSYLALSGTVLHGENAGKDRNVTYKIENEEGTAIVDLNTLTTDKNGKFQFGICANSTRFTTGKYIIYVKVKDVLETVEFTVYEETSGGDNPTPDPDPQPEPEDEKKESDNTKVDKNGGEIELLNEEVVLEIEEGTFDTETEITVNIVNEEEVEVPENTGTTKLKVAGKIYDFNAEDKEFNKPITVTLKYDTEKVNAEKIGVYYYNEETKEWEFIGGIVDEENGTITVVLEHFSKYAVMEYNKVFEDVNIPWANKEIEVLAARHIINGVDENNFNPNGNITRAAFSTLIVKALDLKAGEDKVTFTDVEAGKWYTEYVETAASLGIVNGYNGKFNPNDDITREQMAVMIIRALKYVDPDGDYTVTDTEFTDKDSISEWAKDAAAIAESKGLITGVGQNKFAPKQTATRAMSAVVIYRLLSLLDRI